MNKRNRILIIFVFGVGLPSLILGYLAFRGIQNDQALLEKKNREELLLTLNSIQNTVEEKITSIENSFQTELVKCQNSIMACQRLNEFVVNEPLIEALFVFDQNRQIYFPEKSTLYVKDGDLSVSDLEENETALKEIFDSAQRSEFQDQNYKRALLFYRQYFDKSSSPYGKAAGLNAIARVQKKLNLTEDALQTYRQIKDKFIRIRSSTGFPLGIVSSLEMAELYSTDRQTVSAAEILTELYKDVVNKEWALERSQYVFISNRITTSLSEMFKDTASNEKIDPFKDAFEKIQNSERRQKILTERLLLFQNLDKAEIEGHKNLNKRFSIVKSKDFFCVSPLIEQIDLNGNDRYSCGFLFSADFLIHNIFKEAVEQHVKTDQINWIISKNNGEPLLGGKDLSKGAMTLSGNVIDDLPLWRLELFRRDVRLYESIFSFSRGLYFYMFILIGGILIFGFILTVRTFSHELELARLKSDFVSTISHEFKSPLTAIRQLSEMLQEGRIPSEERRQQYYDVLVEQSDRLSHLTENVLSFAKMEEGKKKFIFESTDIHHLLDEIVSAAGDRVHHDDFDLSLDIDRPLPSIKIDREAVTQAVNNLIDNAIKYSGSSNKVFIKGYKKDAWIVISVQDFGMGIKKEEIDKIFGRFYRGGDELTRTVKGSGLGLTLVKQIIDAHKGTIDVESEIGAGSTFVVKLPIDRPKEK